MVIICKNQSDIKALEYKYDRRVSKDIRDFGGLVWKLGYAECGVPQGPIANTTTSRAPHVSVPYLAEI